MSFASFTFAFFLPLVIAGRWWLPERWRNGWLLLASAVFYLSWGPVWGLLLAFAIGWGYGVGLRLATGARRRTWLAVGVAGCLGTLGFFKYAGWLTAQGWSLARTLGFAGPQPVLDIVLPLGISFYLFQIIGYLIDVYRGHEPERSPWRFALFVSFFPQLVAGPIVRAGQLLPQLARPGSFDGDAFQRGALLLLRGLLKKTVLADGLSRWVDVAFADPTGTSTAGLWLAAFGYAAQIYCDFSGYTDIARGAGAMLGFKLPENFNLPYLATSPQDFWRRWHITLSRWLRDYLYIPLGGNRRGPARRTWNLLLTMGLGGLWHGADWRFVVWGLLHGQFLLLHWLWSRLLPQSARWMRRRASLPYRLVAGAVTLLLVTLAWVIFRAPDLAAADRFLAGMFCWRPQVGFPEPMLACLILLGAVALGHALGPTRWLERLHDRLPAPARGLAWATMIGLIYLGATTTAPFIYFQF